jgi:DNA polymerase-3 subunit epsilon
LRQIVLDTETTGLEADMGHRIIEIGGVEVVNRRLTGRHFHKYVNPEREIDDGAVEVHGITRGFLADKPTFAEIWPEFLDFVEGADLVIHNAPFDVSFINYEMRHLDTPLTGIEAVCGITDSLALARHKHPGQKNNLDALCRRYEVDNSQRELHGALLDAEILADVYLLMTGGQTQLFGSAQNDDGQAEALAEHAPLSPTEKPNLRVVAASDSELAEHEAYLDFLADQSGEPVWRRTLQ